MAELCPALYDTIDCSLPGSSVPGIFQEYWSELPLPSPGDLPNPGIELMVGLAAIVEGPSFLPSPGVLSFGLSFLFELHRRGEVGQWKKVWIL